MWTSYDKPKPKKINLDECKACGSKMTLMLNDYVCDRCNPPRPLFADNPYLRTSPEPAPELPDMRWFTYSTKKGRSVIAEGYRVFLGIAAARQYVQKRAQNTGNAYYIYEIDDPDADPHDGQSTLRPVKVKPAI